MRRWQTVMTAAVLSVLWTAAPMVLSTIPPAYADMVRIEGVSLEVRARIEPGEGIGEETVDASSLQEGKYQIVDCQVLNRGFSWQASCVPEIELKLQAGTDYKFSYIGVKNVKVKGGAFEFVSSKREEKDGVLRLRLKLEPLYSKIQAVETAALSSDGTASWSDTDSAGSYQLIFWRDGKRVTPVLTAYGTRKSLGSYMTEPGSYLLQIRPVSRYDDKYKGDWTKSEGGVITKEDLVRIRESKEKGGSTSDEGKWIQKEGGWSYLNPGDVYAVLQWEQIGKSYYWFDKEGIMATGWIKWKASWYYLQSNGAMLTNAVTPDGVSIGGDGAAAKTPPGKG